MKLKYMMAVILLIGMVSLVGCAKQAVQPAPVAPAPDVDSGTDTQVVEEPEVSVDGPDAEPEGPAPVVGADHTVVYTNAGFEPAELNINAGDKVAWRNDGTKPLVVKSKVRMFQSPRLGNGDTFEYTFESAGSVPYINTIIASQKGSIVVG